MYVVGDAPPAPGGVGITQLMKVIFVGSGDAMGLPPMRSVHLTLITVAVSVTGILRLGEPQVPSY